jgi:hypothetical protein
MPTHVAMMLRHEWGTRLQCSTYATKLHEWRTWSVLSDDLHATV